MGDELRILVTFGICLLLIMLRLEAQKFGAAEYEEVAPESRSSAIRWRLAWYLVGLVLLLLADLIHPNPGSGLFLRLGDGLEAVVYGLAFAAVGTLQAVAFAWLRYRQLQLPSSTRYPGALLNSIGTAFLDEATFRGLLLAFLIGFGVDPSLANLGQAILYGLATRVGSRGRDPYMLVLVLIVGLFSGWLTIITGGIGAAFLGHAATRFAVFLTTGQEGGVDARAPQFGASSRSSGAGWRGMGAEDAGPRG